MIKTNKVKRPIVPSRICSTAFICLTHQSVQGRLYHLKAFVAIDRMALEFACRLIHACPMMTNREHQLLAKIKEWTASPFIGDDCAVLPGWGLVTSDTLVEGTHFRLDWTDLVSLGYKSCAVNLSDIAAMAGRPRFITVALTLPRHFGESELRQLYLGLNQCAGLHRAKIVGGDLTGGEKLAISITAIGDLHEAGVMRRNGARAGDLVIVTGDFGGSGAALSLLNRESINPPSPYAHDLQSSLQLGLLKPGSDSRLILDKHFRPQARLRESWSLVEATCGKGSLMDASDGLADALVQIAVASGVSMQIELNSVPLSPGVDKFCASWGKRDPLAFAFYGGEDYELVGTVPQGLWQNNPQLAQIFKVIGQVSDQTPSVVQFLEDGKSTDRLSGCADLSNCFQHFW